MNGGSPQLAEVQVQRQTAGEKRHRLDDICRRLSIEVGHRHRSIDDVLLTAQAFLLLRERLAKR